MSSEYPAHEFVQKIVAKAHAYGSVALFRAYSDVPELVNGGSARFDLLAAGVSFVGCPCTQDGAKSNTISSASTCIALSFGAFADLNNDSCAFEVDMLVYAMDHPIPGTFFVISDDSRLIYGCSILRMRKYRVVVVSPSDAWHLMQQAAVSPTDSNGLVGNYDDGQGEDSRSCQNLAYVSPTKAPSLIPSLRSSNETTNQLLHLASDVESLVRIPSRNSHHDIPLLSPKQVSNLETVNPDKNVSPWPCCSRHPTCRCALWDKAG